MTDIPVKNTVPRVSTVATAGQTVFSFPFLIFASDQLKVERLPVGATETIPLVETTDYTVTGVDDPDGGTITLTVASFPTGATVNEQFTLFRDIPIERLTDFPFRGGFSSDVINKELDTTKLILQEQDRDISRSFRLQPADALTEAVLPLGRENLFLAFDGAGVPIPAAGTSGNLGPVSAYIDTLLPALNAAAARATLDAQRDLVTAGLITARGDLVVGNATPAASRLALGTTNDLLGSNGTDAVYFGGREFHSGPYTVVAADHLKTISVSGTTTIGLTAAATLGNGFTVTIKNRDGSGVVTVDANGAEVIGAPGGDSETITLPSRGDYVTLVGSGSFWDVISYRVAALQADMEAATATDLTVTPGRAHNHPGVAKAWVNFDGSGTVAIREDYNVLSITDNGTGDYTINIDTDFATAGYCAVGMMGGTGNSDKGITLHPTTAPTVGAISVQTASRSTFALIDATRVFVAMFGDQ